MAGTKVKRSGIARAPSRPAGEQVVPYVCPSDQTSLVPSANELHCSTCAVTYRTSESGIVLLDVINSSQAAAFDAHAAAGQSALTAPEIDGSRRLAERYLALVRRRGATTLKSVLDVAAGRGELCVGLLLNEALADSEIHAIDHSAGSLAVLVGTARSLGVNKKLRASQQDIRALAFPRGSFDLITGNAVLHHFEDVRKFLSDAHALLKPRGMCVFAEPFVEGYLLAMQILKFAVRMTGVPAQSASLGLFTFITENIGERVRNAGTPQALAALTDKHFFSIPRVNEWADQLGFEASFENFEAAGYYDGFLDDILTSYRITSPEVVRTARSLYAEHLAYVGVEFPQLYAHFRFLVLRRRS